MSHRWAAGLLSVTLMLASVQIAFAQKGARTAAGAIVGQVEVDCADSASGSLVHIPGRSFVVFTGPTGEFDLGAVPPGTYTVHVEAGGHSADVPGVVVASGKTTDLGILTLGPDFSTDVDNCGACGVACSDNNAMAACSEGTCQIAACAPTFADCDGSAANGCEVDTLNDPNNCGACNSVCPVGEFCTAGICQLP